MRNRIVRDEQEKKWFSFTNSKFEAFYDDHCSYLPAMAGWFLFSALLSSYNKFVFGQGHMGFPCPLLLTSIHFAIQYFFSYLLCSLFPESLGTERILRPQMKSTEWFSISFPCGVVTALDVGLSNVSLVFISMTFYTMVKSCTPIFVLGWAYLFKLERITWPLVGVVAVIAVGEFFTVLGEVDFNRFGFALCLLASVLSGARWTLVQLKLQTMQPPLKTTIVTMRLLAPCMFWSILISSLIIEQPWTKFDFHFVNQEHSLDLPSDNIDTGDTDSSKLYHTDFVSIVLLGCAGGFLAIAMILCEFYLILHASAIILMIGGVIKEMITIIIGVSLFGDSLNRINLTGCAIVFLGVGLYKIVFHLQKQEKMAIDKQTSHGRGQYKALIQAESPMSVSRADSKDFPHDVSHSVDDDDDGGGGGGGGGGAEHEDNLEAAICSSPKTSSNYYASRGMELLDRHVSK